MYLLTTLQSYFSFSLNKNQRRRGDVGKDSHQINVTFPSVILSCQAKKKIVKTTQCQNKRVKIPLKRKDFEANHIAIVRDGTDF